jgi:2-dehydro-3-deoxyphosphogluconate aldolase / (4S)-4-hydroxy-2-oxoglutarate aldolase
MGENMVKDFFGTLDNTSKPRIIPVLALEDPDQAVELGRTLIDSGLPCAEVVFRTQAAAEVIRELATFENLLLGAGTVLSIDQVKEAMDAGAKFIVAPGFNPQVVEYCLKIGTPVIPGVCTPSEIETALRYGLEILKFFPAQSFGGVKTLKALGGPYPKIKFVPTGGINAKNLREYLSLPNVLACGGSWMVAKQLIAARRYDEISRLTKEAVNLCKEV